MTPDLLRRSGELLYGTQFRHQLANALGISTRSLQRMLAGTVVVPEGIDFDLTALMVSRVISLKKALNEAYHAYPVNAQRS